MKTLTNEQCKAMQFLIKRKYPDIKFDHHRHWRNIDGHCLLCGNTELNGGPYLQIANEHAINHLKEHNLLLFI